MRRPKHIPVAAWEAHLAAFKRHKEFLRTGVLPERTGELTPEDAAKMREERERWHKLNGTAPVGAGAGRTEQITKDEATAPGEYLEKGFNESFLRDFLTQLKICMSRGRYDEPQARNYSEMMIYRLFNSHSNSSLERKELWASWKQLMGEKVEPGLANIGRVLFASIGLAIEVKTRKATYGPYTLALVSTRRLAGGKRAWKFVKDSDSPEKLVAALRSAFDGREMPFNDVWELVSEDFDMMFTATNYYSKPAPIMKGGLRRGHWIAILKQLSRDLIEDDGWVLTLNSDNHRWRFVNRKKPI